MNFSYENQFKFLSELQKETYCLKTVDNIINAVGQQEVLVCLKEKDHKGRCSYFINCEKIKNNSTLSEKDKNKLIDKIHLLSYNTAGETASNSPIKNRSSRWRDRPISMKEQSQLKKESQFRIGIRKDEFSTAAYCQVISIELYESIVNVLNKNKEHNTKCYLCKEELTIENFICSERKNPNSIQGCHLQPLREDAMMHKPGNVKWGHRHCNLMQNDNSVEETLQKIKIILKNNGII